MGEGFEEMGEGLGGRLVGMTFGFVGKLCEWLVGINVGYLDRRMEVGVGARSSVSGMLWNGFVGREGWRGMGVDWD